MIAQPKFHVTYIMEPFYCLYVRIALHGALKIYVISFLNIVDV